MFRITQDYMDKIYHNFRLWSPYTNKTEDNEYYNLNYIWFAHVRPPEEPQFYLSGAEIVTKTETSLQVTLLIPEKGNIHPEYIYAPIVIDEDVTYDALRQTPIVQSTSRPVSDDMPLFEIYVLSKMSVTQLRFFSIQECEDISALWISFFTLLDTMKIKNPEIMKYFDKYGHHFRDVY